MQKNILKLFIHIILFIIICMPNNIFAENVTMTVNGDDLYATALRDRQKKKEREEKVIKFLKEIASAYKLSATAPEINDNGDGTVNVKFTVKAEIDVDVEVNHRNLKKITGVNLTEFLSTGLNIESRSSVVGQGGIFYFIINSPDEKHKKIENFMKGEHRKLFLFVKLGKFTNKETLFMPSLSDASTIYYYFIKEYNIKMSLPELKSLSQLKLKVLYDSQEYGQQIKLPTDTVIRQNQRDKQKTTAVPSADRPAKMSESEVNAQTKEYIGVVWSRVKPNFTMPQSLLPEKYITAIIDIRIARSGALEYIGFEKRSGNSDFDDSALEAVKKSSPFPPLPNWIMDKSIEIGIRFHSEELKEKRASVNDDGWREETVKLDSLDIKYVKYLAKIKNKVLQLWKYPQRAYENNEEGDVIVKISVNADGSLAGATLVSSSGYAELDNGALSVVKSAAPFEPLPEIYNLSRLNIVASFHYKITD